MPVRNLRFLIAVAIVVSASSVTPAQWISFTDQTATYLQIPNVGSDPEEKDFLLGDLDNDGDLDLVNARKEGFYGDGPRTHLLIMNVNGVMTDQTATYAPGFNANPSLARVVLIGDFENDGWKDVVIVNTNSQVISTNYQTHYYKNLGSSGGTWLGLQFQTGHFPNYTTPVPRFCSAAAGDMDNDGDLDIFMGDYNNTLEDRLLRNDGNAVFTDVTAAKYGAGGANASVFSVEANFADMDQDGDNDIVETNGTVGELRVHVNGGAPNYNFTVVNIAVGGATYTNAIGDLNNDGKIDIYQGRDGQDAYTINNIPPGGAITPANFTTTTLTNANAPKTTNFAGNAYLVDMDGDGDRDLAMGDTDVDVPGCNRRAVLYRNGTIGPSQTQLLMDPWGATNVNINTQGTHDLAILDLNGDGLMDIINGRCVGYHVFIQDGPPFALAVTEPQPGALNMTVVGGVGNTDIYTLISTVIINPAGSGPFFGMDPSAYQNFLNLYPSPPVFGQTDGAGAFGFSLPAGSVPSPFPTQWRSAQLVGPLGYTLSNVVTITF
jgi:FG-GAP-like repeat